MKRLILTLLAVVTCSLQSQILIFTHSYNRADFIKIQHDLFDKFLKERDYTFIVFNDASNPTVANEIRTTSQRLQIQCIDIPQKIHTYAYLQRWPGESYNNSCVRCANVIQYSLNEIGLKHDDILVIIDSDMFLVKEFSIRDFMRDVDLAGVPQSRGGMEYIWNGLVFFNMKTLPNKQQINFNCGFVNGNPVDVGGQMYHYLQNNRTVQIKHLNQFYLSNNDRESLSIEVLKKNGFDLISTDFILSKPPNVEFIHDNHFLHYRGGTNWDRKQPEYHAHKTSLLQQYVDALLGK